MKVIAGLGNPGKEYERTPHNVGFAVVEELARRMECRLRRSFRFKARMAEALWEGEPVLLVQPLTFMNRSGDAVGSILRYRKLGAENLVVILDDADLDFGRLRIRNRGSSGGHKGLMSVIQAVGSDAFARIRLGVGHAREASLVEHVLRPFSAEEREKVEAEVLRASDAVLCLLKLGVEAAMNGFNGVADRNTNTKKMEDDLEKI